jgi:hypothetical protein
MSMIQGQLVRATEQAKKEKLAAVSAAAGSASFGRSAHLVRSYVLNPYQLVSRGGFGEVAANCRPTANPYRCFNLNFCLLESDYSIYFVNKACRCATRGVSAGWKVRRWTALMLPLCWAEVRSWMCFCEQLWWREEGKDAMRGTEHGQQLLLVLLLCGGAAVPNVCAILYPLRHQIYFQVELPE